MSLLPWTFQCIINTDTWSVSCKGLLVISLKFLFLKLWIAPGYTFQSPSVKLPLKCLDTKHWIFAWEVLLFHFYFRLQVTCEKKKKKKKAILTRIGAEMCRRPDCLMRSDDINSFGMWISSTIAYKEAEHLCRWIYTQTHTCAEVCACTHTHCQEQGVLVEFKKKFCILP